MDEIAILAAIGALEQAELDAVRGRRILPHGDGFGDLWDDEFIKIYRLTKPVASDLIDALAPYLVHPTRLSALSIEQKVLATLEMYAVGSYQTGIGLNYYHGLSQPSVSRVVEEVTNAINHPDIFRNHIKLPQNLHELQQVRATFFEKFNFPGVVGCIDCTHIAIFPPRGQLEHMYVNRKGYHSINTQLICDSKEKILNVCARYPGSTNDSFIWQNSEAYGYFRQLHERGHNNYLLLGDSGYPLRKWMMTPILKQVEPESPEERYNVCQRRCRNCIERCNGTLKARFRCLLKHRVLLFEPEKCCRIIKACCVLHNICIDHNVPFEPPEEENIDYGLFNNNMYGNPDGGPRVNPELLAGRQLRASIVRNHFN